MTRFEFLLFHTASALVAITGLCYGWMRYFCDPDTEFSVVNHPWQPHVQHAHLLVAPFLIGMVGHFWLQHIWPHWKSQLKIGRRTGVSLWILLIPMILSGYCIQVVVHPTARVWWIWIHGVTSILWLCSYVGHTIVHLRARRLSTGDGEEGL